MRCRHTARTFRDALSVGTPAWKAPTNNRSAKNCRRCTFFNEVKRKEQGAEVLGFALPCLVEIVAKKSIYSQAPGRPIILDARESAVIVKVYPQGLVQCYRHSRPWATTMMPYSWLVESGALDLSFEQFISQVSGVSNEQVAV